VFLRYIQYTNKRAISARWYLESFPCFYTQNYHKMNHKSFCTWRDHHVQYARCCVHPDKQQASHLWPATSSTIHCASDLLKSLTMNIAFFWEEMLSLVGRYRYFGRNHWSTFCDDQLLWQQEIGVTSGWCNHHWKLDEDSLNGKVHNETLKNAATRHFLAHEADNSND